MRCLRCGTKSRGADRDIDCADPRRTKVCSVRKCNERQVCKAQRHVRKVTRLHIDAGFDSAGPGVSPPLRPPVRLVLPSRGEPGGKSCCVPEKSVPTNKTNETHNASVQDFAQDGARANQHNKHNSPVAVKLVQFPRWKRLTSAQQPARLRYTCTVRSSNRSRLSSSEGPYKVNAGDAALTDSYTGSVRSSSRGRLSSTERSYKVKRGNGALTDAHSGSVRSSSRSRLSKSKSPGKVLPRNAALTDAEVSWALEKYFTENLDERMTQLAIAQQLQVSQQAIARLVRSESWSRLSVETLALIGHSIWD